MKTTNVQLYEPPGEDPVKYRIGLIALGTSETTERDFISMLPDEHHSFHTTRIRDVNPVTVESLRAMGPDLAAAARDLLPGIRLDAIAYDCTTGTAALGADEVKRQIQAGRPGVPVATPATGALEALDALNVSKIGLLVPNIDPVAEMLGEYFEKNGVTLTALHNFNIPSDIEMARVTPESIVRAVVTLAGTGCDAVFVSCTALRCLALIESLENDLAIPVLSSNQCLFWQALRAAGSKATPANFGRLFRDF